VTDPEKKEALRRYRLRQAEESLEEARYLFAGGKSTRSVVNRLYYAMLYAVLALLIDEPFSSSKHTGVMSYFNRRFIRENVFPESMGRSFNKAFEMRQRSDYREYADASREEVEPLMDAADNFIKTIQKYLVEKFSGKET